jgi:hypothetical protein
MSAKKEVLRLYLADFAAQARGLDRNAKLKLVLLAAGKKPATYIPLRITPKNLDEKAELERRLARAGFIFRASEPKTFEVIEKVKGGTVFWRQEGLWIGYDIFSSKKVESLFRRYEVAAKARKHVLADALGAKVYGYPACCAKAFHREHDPSEIAKKHNSYEYFRLLHDAERRFPFITHKVCSLSCAASRKQNAFLRAAVKDICPRFYREYTAPLTFESAFIVQGEHDVYAGDVEPYVSVWRKKDGHEYSLLALKKFGGHYFMHSYLTRERFPKGQKLFGCLKMVHNYADISIRKKGRVFWDLRHIRRFPLLSSRRA